MSSQPLILVLWPDTMLVIAPFFTTIKDARLHPSLCLYLPHIRCNSVELPKKVGKIIKEEFIHIIFDHSLAHSWLLWKVFVFWPTLPPLNEYKELWCVITMKENKVWYNITNVFNLKTTLKIINSCDHCNWYAVIDQLSIAEISDALSFLSIDKKCCTTLKYKELMRGIIRFYDLSWT